MNFFKWDKCAPTYNPSWAEVFCLPWVNQNQDYLMLDGGYSGQGEHFAAYFLQFEGQSWYTFLIQRIMQNILQWEWLWECHL